MTTSTLRGPRAARSSRPVRRRRWRIYPRHRLDLSARHLALALGSSILGRAAERGEAALEAALGVDEAIVCFSVRSGFELLLDALGLPQGSEVLVSAITHPDMVRILERHGLVAVPVDLDLRTLAPRPDRMAAAVSPRTRAVLVAHLFGGRADLDETVRIARRHGLVLLEDCAQAFLGPADRGDPRADVSMFSFGSIKTSAALGGAVLYVRRWHLVQAMRSRRAFWPRQSRWEYCARAVRFCGLHVLESPWIYGTVVGLGRLAGADVDAVVDRAVHALRPPPGGREESFERWLRRRPSAPLLAVLADRLRSFDADRLRRRAERGEDLAGRLPPWLFHPGDRARERTHWVFPVLADDPAALIAALRAAGFDATRGTTSIAAIPARSTATTRPFAPTRSRAIWDQPPGAAPRSTTTSPSLKSP